MMMLMMLMTIETPIEDIRAAKDGPPSLPVGPPFNSIAGVVGITVPLLGKLSKSAMILLVLALGAGTGHVSIVTAGREASTFGVVGAVVNTKEGMTGSKFM